MQRLFPPQQRAVLLRGGKVEGSGESISELGCFGCLVVDPDGTILHNKYAGFLLRTKFSGVDEGGVASGFATLSSPYLCWELYPHTDNEHNALLIMNSQLMIHGYRLLGFVCRCWHGTWFSTSKQSRLVEHTYILPQGLGSSYSVICLASSGPPTLTILIYNCNLTRGSMLLLTTVTVFCEIEGSAYRTHAGIDYFEYPDLEWRNKIEALWIVRCASKCSYLLTHGE